MQGIATVEHHVAHSEGLACLDLRIESLENTSKHTGSKPQICSPRNVTIRSHASLLCSKSNGKLKLASTGTCIS
jgi:hypothetical protein